MTHPDTLTIPRAVVEQLHVRLLSGEFYDDYDSDMSLVGALRAALQPQATQAASDCRTCQHLSEAWGVCEARPKCVGGEQYVYFPEKQLWDKTPRNNGQAAHQEMREAVAEFNRAVGRQHD